ncbi:hypothetical protein D3C80_2103940 [compost metagenome]
MRYKLKYCALQANLIEGGEAEQHDPHMTDGGIGQHKLQILLPKCKQRSIQNIDDA